MLRVGITGGMGSGKTTIARMFQVLGIPVYFADDEAKNLMNHDPALKQAIMAIFGHEAYNLNGLNREFISSVAFSEPDKLKALNAIVHPAVMAHGKAWMLSQYAPYSLKEAALLFESGSNKQLDLIIGVWCPVELRIERVMNRDSSSREQVLARMQKQMNEEEKMKLCDFVITNDERMALIPQVLSLHGELLSRNI
jgi:dephospho-CoA kinase